MDGHGFDRFARSLVAPGSRRRLLAAWFGATLTAVAAAAGFAKRPTDAQSCAAEDEPCTLMVGCCPGLICATLPLNVNSGVCVPGEVRTVSENDPGDGRNPRPTNTSDPTKTPKPTKTPSPDRTPKPTKTPESNKRASLTLRLQCQGKEEELEIENTGDVSVTIEKIKALSPPEGTKKREFKKNLLLTAGLTLRFTSGSDKPDPEYHLSDDELYPDEGDNANAVEVTTSGGVFRAACSKEQNNGGGDDNDCDECLKITVVCGPDVDQEETKVENTGAKKVVLVSVDEFLLADQEDLPPTELILGKDEDVTFYSGPDVTSTTGRNLTVDRLYENTKPGSTSRIKIVTKKGTHFAVCEIPKKQRR